MNSTSLLRSTLVLLALALVACEVTSEKIQQWKQSEKGAAKLRYALRDAKQKIAIRAEAADALGENGLFAPMAEDLKTITAGDRRQIVEELVKRLLVRMKGSNPKSTSKVQIQAKDALYAVREFAEESQKTIDDELARWLLADWQNRQEGESSGEKIIRAIGVRAGPWLAEQVAVDSVTLKAFPTLLREVGDQGARDAGAERLVELAKKQTPIEELTLAALGRVGSLKASAYLEGLAKKGEAADRIRALQALAWFPHPSLVPTAKAIAADGSLKDDAAQIRDEAFTLLEKINDPAALDALLSFLGEKDDKVRYRAVEAVVEGFGVKALTKLLETLPVGYTYKKVDLTDFVENDIVKLGAKALPAMRSALESKSWIAKLIAVHVLSRIGTTEDVPALEKLTSDGTKLRGWAGGDTVGTEAKAAAEKLKSRK